MVIARDKLERAHTKLDPDIRAAYQDIHTLLAEVQESPYRQREQLLLANAESLLDTVDVVLRTDPSLVHVSDSKVARAEWKKIGSALFKLVCVADEPKILDKSLTTLAQALTTVDDQHASPVDDVIVPCLSEFPLDPNNPAAPLDSKRHRIELLLEAACSQYGMNGKRLFSAWYDSHKKTTVNGNPRLAALKNFRALRGLEQHNPDAAKTLADAFGVLCYARYPDGLLEEQLHHIEDSESPYGIIIAPRDDYNGSSYGDKKALQSLWEQVREAGYRLRVIECATKMGLARQLLTLDKRYNQPIGQQAAFGVLLGHTNESVISLGTDKLRGRIDMTDIITSAFNKGRHRFFAPGATLVTTGCLLGRPGQLAEQAATALDITILASPHKTEGMKSITVHPRQSGPPAFSASFKHHTFLASQAARFTRPSAN